VVATLRMPSLDPAPYCTGGSCAFINSDLFVSVHVRLDLIMRYVSLLPSFIPFCTNPFLPFRSLLLHRIFSIFPVMHLWPKELFEAFFSNGIMATGSRIPHPHYVSVFSRLEARRSLYLIVKTMAMLLPTRAIRKCLLLSYMLFFSSPKCVPSLFLRAPFFSSDRL